MNSEQISNGAEDMSTGFFYHYPDFRFLFQKKNKKMQNRACNPQKDVLFYYSCREQHISGCSAVGSALDWGSRGREFKSRHSDQKRA